MSVMKEHEKINQIIYFFNFFYPYLYIKNEIAVYTPTFSAFFINKLITN